MNLEFLKCLRNGLLGLSLSTACLAAELSEQDYFHELPTVLTVSRLAQPLSETPGAVTVIDREIIRRSGARELADVLRLVPGYLVGGYNGANPLAAYHAPIDDFGARNLVMIDGRPVYSTYYQGDTHRGMMGVLLEDIERIEVLRGSNSAAYGANAMFGVINIITRNSADDPGSVVSVTGGAGGVKDNYARIGWGDETASFRLSTGRRSDNGYRHAYDDKIVSQLHLRGDLRLPADQEVSFAAGVSQLASGEGFPLGTESNVLGGNALRTALFRDVYLNGSWSRQLSEKDQLKLTANLSEETFRDEFPYAADPSVVISSSGRGRRANLEFQHQLGIHADLRAVWGAGYKYEEAQSFPLYNRQDAVSFHEERVFGNFEWRPHPRWLINAGGLWGRHSRVGSYFSPRLMANLHVAQDHTLRAGITESARMPTLYELKADVRYFPQNLEPFHTLRLFGVNLPYRLIAATGNAQEERLYTQELGYFGNFRDRRLTIDVRAYIERMRDRIDDFTYFIPGYITVAVPPVNFPLKVGDFGNTSGFKVRGAEYQLRWKPLADTELWLNQSFQRLIWEEFEDRQKHQPASHATTLALFQKLPGNLDLSLMYYSMSAMSWSNDAQRLPRRNRLDIRLAYPFRVAGTRAEAAVVVQAANGSYQEYRITPQFLFERRAFGTLRLEF
jgi:iron complex outermembrane recepter protein